MRPSERLLVLSAVASVFTAAALSQSIAQSLRNRVAVTISVHLNSSFAVPFTGRMPFAFTLHMVCADDASFELSSGLCTLRTNFDVRSEILHITMPRNGASEERSVAHCAKAGNVVVCVVQFSISNDNVTHRGSTGKSVLSVPCEWKTDDEPLTLNIRPPLKTTSCKTAYMEVDGFAWHVYERTQPPTMTTANTSSQMSTNTTSLPCMTETTRVHVPDTGFAGIAWWGWFVIGATGTLVIVLLVAVVAAVAVCSSRRSKKTPTQKQEESEEDTKEVVTVPSKKPPSESKTAVTVDTSKLKRPDAVQPKLESKESSAPHPAMQSNNQYIKSLQSVPNTAVERSAAQKDSEKVDKAPQPMPRKQQMTLEKPKKGDGKQGEIDTLEDPALDRWNSAEESATQKKFSKRSPEDLNPVQSKGKGRPLDEVRTRDTQISSVLKPLTHENTPQDIKNW